MVMIDIVNINNNSTIDRTYGIKQILSQFNQDLFQVNQSSVLDIFAGDGSYCSYLLGNKAKSIDCISINQDNLDNISKIIPKATTILGDSFQVIKNLNKRYDIVFCDNAQGIMPNGKTEYFDLLEDIPYCLNPGGYFIHNVNILPYNYNLNSTWGKLRNKFYGKDSSNLSLDFVKDFHINKMSALGLNLEYVKLFPREKFNSKIYLYFILYKFN